MGRVWGMSTKQSGAHDCGHTEAHRGVSHLLWAPPAPGVGLSSPHRYTAWPPLVHPHSAPSPTQVPRMLPPWARPAAAISLEWQCWHVTGFRAPIVFFFAQHSI